MKIFSVIGIVFFVLAGFTSCTVEKRHYRGGFYVDWNNSSDRTVVSKTIVAPSVETDLIISAPELVDSIADEVGSFPFVSKDAHIRNDIPKNVQRVSVSETPAEEILNSEKIISPMPIEKDKKQATGAGIASAIFFLLGMTGLIIKGTGGAAGIFIVSAFVCCVLCIMLASFLYPREPVVAQPKEQAVGSDPMAVAALVFVAIMLGIVGFVAFVLLSFLGAF